MTTRVSEPISFSMEAAGDTVRWLRFLSRWAGVTTLMVIALLLVYMGGLGFAASDNALGFEYSELLMAARAPTMYRLSMTFDAAGWLMMGGALLILAFILKNRSPMRALLIAACGVGLLTGMLGGVMRLVGISDLAVHYSAATPSQQAALLQPMLALFEIVNAHFVAGDILAGAGYWLVASAAFALAGFPRWLAGWFVLAGVLTLLQSITSALGAFSFPILMLTIIVGVLGLHLALAAAFWRPSSALADALAPH